MAETYKINFFFKARLWGWSETYYAEYADIRAALDSAKEVVPHRVLLLGGTEDVKNPRLEKIRVSNVVIQRDSLVEQVALANSYNDSGLLLADNPNLCLLVRCEATDLYRRQLYLSGFPDLLCSDQIYQPIGAYPANFQTFADTLIARGWGIYARNRAEPIVTIFSIDRTEGGLVEVTTEAPHGLTAGKLVQIRSAPGTIGIRGIHFVLASPTANRFMFVGTYGGMYRGGGTAQRVRHSLQRFTRLQIVGIGRKGRGRPTDSPVGRRRRRRSA